MCGHSGDDGGGGVNCKILVKLVGPEKNEGGGGGGQGCLDCPCNLFYLHHKALCYISKG